LRIADFNRSKQRERRRVSCFTERRVALGLTAATEDGLLSGSGVSLFTFYACFRLSVISRLKIGAPGLERRVALGLTAATDDGLLSGSGVSLFTFYACSVVGDKPIENRRSWPERRVALGLTVATEDGLLSRSCVSLLIFMPITVCP